MRNRKLKVLALMVLVSVSVWGQWSSNGSTIYTNSNEIHFNYANNKTGTIWLNRNGSGPGERGHYYIKAFDYWGAFLHFVGTGDQDNERMTVTFDGKVGIGTVNPLAKLHIENGTLDIGNKDYEGALRFRRNSDGAAVGEIGLNSSTEFRYKHGGGGGYFTFFTNSASQVTEKMRITNNGNVGIGTTDPQSRLSIEGNINGWMQTIKGSVTNKDQFIGIKFNTGYMDEYNKWCGIAAIGENLHSNISSLGFYANQTEKMRLLGTGELGIGTLNPKAKLDVAGNIKAQEIEVTLASIDDMQLNGTLAANNITLTTNGNTADFVFEDDYMLRDLSEVESFIKTNKHLPDIPSAAQMEEQGVNLAEMNKLLLQKVEELTLYAIQQEEARKKAEEERRKEKGERETLETRSQQLEERLEKLEALLLGTNTRP